MPVSGVLIVNSVSLMSVVYFDLGVKFVSNRWIALNHVNVVATDNIVSASCRRLRHGA